MIYNVSYYLFTDYVLIAEGAVCNGQETDEGNTESVGSCAVACEDKSEMFIYQARGKYVGTCYCQQATLMCRCRVQGKSNHFDLYAFGKFVRTILLR